MSTLTAFPFIEERSEATPGLWNRMFSQLSDNIQSIASGPFETFLIGTASRLTTEVLTVGASSATADYLAFVDTSNARSNYLLGSRVGGTADGLNLYDVSGNTMIASFSKQSVRFFQNVVGPVFDTGGALADTYNAATFIGSGSTLSGIQAAINQASIDGVSRVYLPASMYPYSTSSISFIASVQMVREGGDWSVYDVLAYGIAGDNATDHTFNLQSVESVRPANAIVRLSKGTYLLNQSLATQLFRIVKPGTYDFRGTAVQYGGAVNLTTGSDGGGLGVINVLTNDVELHGGTLHGNGKARYLLARQGETDRCGFFGSIRSTLTTSGVWPGIWLRVSADVAGPGTYAGKLPARSMYGILSRASCPMVDTSDSITSYDNVTAFILGGDAVTGENTGVAIVMGSAYNVAFARLDKLGLMTSMKIQEDNDHWLDSTWHDVGCNTFELHGSAPSTNSDGYPPNTIWGGFVKSGANFGWFHYNVFSGSTIYPNINLSGGSSYQDGKLDIYGQIRAFDGSAITAPYSYRSETSLGFYRSGASILALSYGQLAVPAGSSMTPAIGFSSETSLGFFRSAASSIALSYGTFKLAPNDRSETLAMWHVGSGNWRIGKVGTNTGSLTLSTDSGAMAVGAGVGASLVLQTGGGVTRTTIDSAGNIIFANASFSIAGSAIAPSKAFSSESSLGWYRSGTSALALSYGTVDLTNGGAVTSVASLTIKAGTNNSCGTAVLGSNGSVNVANTYVKTGDLIFLTDQTPGGTLGDLEILGIRNSSGFTVASTSVTDTSTVAWLIVRPG